MIFLGWNRASCFPPALGWELFSWGLKPSIALGGRVCRWVLFPGHSGNGNAASAPSAPRSCPHTAAQEEAGAGSRGRTGLEVRSAQRGSCSSCCPAGSCPGAAEGGTGLPKGGCSKTRQQNRPAPSTALPRAGPALRSHWQSVIQSKITLSIFDYFVSLSEGPGGASATPLRERQAGAWVTGQQRSVEG